MNDEMKRAEVILAHIRGLLEAWIGLGQYRTMREGWSELTDAQVRRVRELYDLLRPCAVARIVGDENHLDRRFLLDLTKFLYPQGAE